MLRIRKIGLAALAALAPALAACGPSHAQIDPRNVVNVTVRPASGQLLYCPGDEFQVEVVAKLKDGTTCSNVDGNRGCLGKDDQVIAPELVRIGGSSGVPLRQPGAFLWAPNPDPLATADSGMTLRGWLEGVVEGKTVKSMEGEALLRPVYECQQQGIYTILISGRAGDDGRPGPEVTVAITTLSTPFYPNAALIRVEWQGTREYFISPSADKPVRIISKGQDGLPGVPGQDGAKGRDGKNAEQECAKGEDGGNGAPGQPGGPGGDGGPGGPIKVILDEANADKLRGRLLLASVGGDPGQGGLGGHGGFGGQGGFGGPLKAGTSLDSCKPVSGEHGKKGADGLEGPRGNRGADGPAPTFEMQPRQTLFANELGIIQRIESAKAKR
ncbi:hypothetical protein [Polyangium aurulentum]|uniref:hypothetical protein n=1 Tax=Polyangium aurulentum TaxID=2567896 RepID=UPI0010AE55D0|nr:hypothetical protein [Polyangium aurulentum]UQA61758.1 hypothetical protein E8A73_015320 [Polyangium aurulentum]